MYKSNVNLNLYKISQTYKNVCTLFYLTAKNINYPDNYGIF